MVLLDVVGFGIFVLTGAVAVKALDRDDQVVVNSDIQDFPRLVQAFPYLAVFLARLKATRWMVVDSDDTIGAVENRFLEDFSRKANGLVQRAHSNQFLFDDFHVGVEM